MNSPHGKGGVHFGSFREAVAFLEGGVNLEKKTYWTYSAKKLDLGRMEKLLEFLGNPHRCFRSIHIAGTKGKGSTASLIASCLQHAGYRTGLFTSPHLVSPCERMRVDGSPAPEDAFCRLLGKVKDYVAAGRARGRLVGPTYFEILTGLGLEYFREKGADWAVVEVGLGGRLDSTNVLSPECCVITPIGFDHTDKLGSDIESIAAEKAGILKPAVPVVLGQQRYVGALEVLRGKADALGCPRWEVGREVRVLKCEPVGADGVPDDQRAGWRFAVQTPGAWYADVFVPFLGSHQVENCASVIAALELLKQAGRLRITSAQVHAGIAAARCPARIGVLQRRPLLILDSAHTVESVEALVAALRVHFPGRKPALVFGCSLGKNLPGMLRPLREHCLRLIPTQADSPRAVPADQVASAARESGIETADPVVPASRAVREALSLAGPEGMVCVSGSFFIAGEVWADWMRRHGKQGT